MGDRFATSGELGGVIAAADFDALLEGIMDQGCGPDWGGSWGLTAKDKAEIEQYVLGAVFAGTPVRLMDDECSDGFETLMDVARKIGASVKVHVEAKYDYDATIQLWRPGWRSTEIVEAVNAGPAVSLERLRKALEDNESVADLILRFEKFEADVEAMTIDGHKVVKLDDGKTFKLEAL